MDLSTITYDDFKAYFRRDFPYLPEYSPTKLYNIDNVVYYATTELFYKCTVDGTIGITPDTVANWERITDDIDNYILSFDVEKAFDEAQIVFNQALFDSDKNIELGYLYLTAHYLVNDIRASLSGLESKGNFAVSSRSVGNVSESYDIPDAYKNDPNLQFYTGSQYGMKYLSLILPKLVGNVISVAGATSP